MNEFLYVEKYRPQTIEDTILPKPLKETFKDFVEIGEIPNLLLCGSAGVGKTTIAKALCNELNADFIVINGSDEGRLIDTLRTKIKNFASTVSLSSSAKVVILDEADYISADSVQPALRNFIEEFSSNCRFIFTCNYKNKIIEPLHSRCAVVEFSLKGKEKQQVAAAFFKRLSTILENERIDADKKVLAELVQKHFPDFRRVLNEVQRYSTSGKIDSGILATFSEVKVEDLIRDLKASNFTEVRKWVVANLDNDTNTILRKVYDALYSHLKGPSIAAAVLIIAKYQYQSAFVADQEINLLAALTEIMIECDFQ